MAGSEHRLADSLVGLTIDAAEARQSYDDHARGLAATDMLQHVQLPISGKCKGEPVITELTVNFPYPFLLLVAPGATESDLEAPHFVFGVQMVAASRYVNIDVQVIDYPVTARGFMERARLRVVAFSPGAPKKINFSAVIHMTFTGYAAPTETDAEG